jgi:hypothetical protein
MPAPKLKYVDITPTWVSLMPALFALIQNGTDFGRAQAKEELMDLARKVDEINKHTGGRP